MSWHYISKKNILKRLDSSMEKGLSDREAQKRLKKYGYNILKVKKKKGIAFKFFEQFKDFMIITLIFAAAISFFTSYLHKEPDFIEPGIILLIIILNALLGVYQEAKAEKSLEALQKMSAPTAQVLRNGKKIIVEARNLVPGDIFFLEAGNYVPAEDRKSVV